MTSTALPSSRLEPGFIERPISEHGSAAGCLADTPNSVAGPVRQGFGQQLESLLQEASPEIIPENKVTVSRAEAEISGVQPKLDDESGPQFEMSADIRRSSITAFRKPISRKSPSLITGSLPIVSHGAVWRSDERLGIKDRKHTGKPGDLAPKKVNEGEVLHPAVENVLPWVPSAQLGTQASESAPAAKATRRDAGAILRQNENCTAPEMFQRAAPSINELGSIVSNEAKLKERFAADTNSISAPARPEQGSNKENDERGPILKSNEEPANPGKSHATGRNSVARFDVEMPVRKPLSIEQSLKRTEPHVESASAISTRHNDSFPRRAGATAARSHDPMSEASIVQPGRHDGIGSVAEALQTVHSLAKIPPESGLAEHQESSNSARQHVEVRSFEALDRQPDEGRWRWTNTGMSRAEAGFADPSIGWISVRAHADASGVHASVVSGSTEAAQALAPHMYGLNLHVASQRPDIHPVTLSFPDSGWGFGGFGGEMSRRNGEENDRRNQGPTPGEPDSVKPTAFNSFASRSADENVRNVLFSSVTPAFTGAHFSAMV